MSVTARLLLMGLLLPCAVPAWAKVWTYPEHYTVTQGDELPIYASSDSGELSLSIRRMGENQYRVTDRRIPARSKTLPDRPWRTSPNWPVSERITIERDWPSGFYQFLFEDKGTGEEQQWFVVVKEDNPGSRSRIAMLDIFTTELAYSNLAEKSVYGYNSSPSLDTESGLNRAAMMTLDQPVRFTQHWNMLRFIDWTKRNNIDIEVISMLDLEERPEILDAYKTIVTVGHNEYWSWTMRENFDNFLAGGGNAMILSGNTMWWQIRMENDKMLAYKSTDKDPQFNTNNPQLSAIQWKEPVVGWRENSTIGVSFENGGYHNFGGYFLESEGFGGYEVTSPNHWVFEGTGLEFGDTFGQEETIVGYEVDGALFENVDGRLLTTGEDNTPAGLEVLATAPAYFNGNNGAATMLLFQAPVAQGRQDGGWVFNAATVDWAAGLPTDRHTQQITLNVLERFSRESDDSSNNGSSNNGSSNNGSSNNSSSNNSSSNNSSSNNGSSSNSSSNSSSSNNSSSPQGGSNSVIRTNTSNSDDDDDSAAGMLSLSGLFGLLLLGLRRRVSRRA